MRASLLALPAIALSFALPAQTPQGSVSGETFSSDALQLKLSWSPSLNQQQPTSAIRNGQLALPAFYTPGADSEVGSLESCLRPALFLQSPDAEKAGKETKHPNKANSPAYETIVLAELDKSCLSPAASATFGNAPALPSYAKRILAAPGMTQVAQPNPYNVSGHPVVMVEAQGHPAPIPNAATPAPFDLYTMVVATEWNNHTLFFLLSANTIDRLDTLSKSRVQFGTAPAEPLYGKKLVKAGALLPPKHGG